MKDEPDKATPDALQLLIESIRNNREEELRKLYRLHKEPFLNWARQRYSLPEDDLLDAFQEAVIVFYKKIVSGALTTLHASAKTYLFGIAKNKLRKRYAQQARYEWTDEVDENTAPDYFEDPVYQRIEDQHLAHVMSQAIKKLGEKCRKLLQMSFYDNFALEAIAERMNYKNSQVVSSQLYKCIRRLKKLADGML